MGVYSKVIPRGSLHELWYCYTEPSIANFKQIMETEKRLWKRYMLGFFYTSKYAMASSAPYIVEWCILIYHTLDGWLDPSVYFVYFANANQE